MTKHSLVECKRCGKQMAKCDYARHFVLNHRAEREEEWMNKANAQLMKEVTDEENEPRIGPLNPADIFR